MVSLGVEVGMARVVRMVVVVVKMVVSTSSWSSGTITRVVVANTVLTPAEAAGELKIQCVVLLMIS